MTNFNLRYDLRAPAFGRADAATLYSTALDQATWAEDQGFGSVMVSEHHGAEDGYLPSPFVFGAALAARTSTMRLRFAAAVATLHHPLELAEDVAVLDLVSGGRVQLVLGCGYRRAEYAMLGRPDAYDRRGALLEQYVGILRQAWTGEPFDHEGTTVRVTPRPVQPRVPVVLGGATAASARRAARVADGYAPVPVALGELWPVYVATCEELGREPAPEPPRTNGAAFVHVAEDPDAAWAAIAPHALHETNSYAQWWAEEATGEVRSYEPITDAEALRASGMYNVLTPEECVDFARDLDEVNLHALMGGLPPELSWSSLELIAKKVVPALRRTSGT